jgi:hypothetical protein
MSLSKGNRSRSRDERTTGGVVEFLTTLRERVTGTETRRRDERRLAGKGDRLTVGAAPADRVETED